MTNVPFTSLADYRDIDSLNSYMQLVEIEQTVRHDDKLRYLRKSSRDNARTPMQWDDSLNAGFSKGNPWIMVNPNYQEINAQEELENCNSVFYTYQKLIRLRKAYDILTEGSYEEILIEDEHIFAYKRKLNNQELVVYCNFSNQEVDCDESFVFDDAKVFITNNDKHQKGKLKAYEAIVYIQEK